tara:strand:+ start:17300 stop:18013 length:714 start_codon:yes stop_codon:yes gene_type:complete
LSQPKDISIPIKSGKGSPVAWYIDPPEITPVVEGKWTALVREGAVINFQNIHFNPHGHGTHTECVGHITEEVYSINNCLKQFFYTAEVITVAPEMRGEDQVITLVQIQNALLGKNPEAVVIRTLPNGREKKSKNWSHTNWPYMLSEAAVFLREIGIKHLLIDLPSVDKEKDEGELASHRAFWDMKHKPRFDATITEMIFVPHGVKDGSYLLNLQIAPFENDASPSKPILYKIIDEDE